MPSTQTTGKSGILGALGEARTVYSLLFIYCAVHLILRMGLSLNFSPAEARQVLFGQSLQWMYQPHQPPLMSWLSWGALQTGGGRAGLFLLKYVLMGAGLFAFFGAARAILNDVRLAALATFALLCGYTLGYLVHADMMAGVLVFALSAGFVWAAVRALTTGTHNEYLLLGVITGLGVLSDYAFIVLPVAFAVSVALTPGVRIRPRPMLGAALLACAIAAPFAWWTFANEATVFAPATSGAMAGAASPVAAVTGYAAAIAGFALPFALLFAGIYWRALRPLADCDPQTQRWLRVLGLTIVIALLLLLAAILAFGAASFAPAQVVPALIALPLWLFLRARISAESERAMRMFFWSAIALIFIALVARVALFETGAVHCRTCRDYWPVERFTASIRNSGFALGTVVVPTADLGGDLRNGLAQSRIVVAGTPPGIFGPEKGAQCLVVWRGNGAMPKSESDYLANVLGARIDALAIHGDVEAMLLTSKTRRDRLSFVLLPAGGGRCN